jgi:hypothetical protein
MGRHPTASEAQASRTEYDERMRDAQARKERVQKRVAARGKPAASGLPVPP